MPDNVAAGFGVVTNGLTNLRQEFSAGDTSALNRFAPGSAFSAVYNPTTREFLAYPSGESRLLSGEEPPNLVPRRGGHGAVNRRLCQMTGILPTSNVAFTVFLDEDGAISIEWRSGSVNAANPSFQGDLVPEALRSQIIEDICKATGRTLRLR